MHSTARSLTVKLATLLLDLRTCSKSKLAMNNLHHNVLHHFSSRIDLGCFRGLGPNSEISTSLVALFESVVFAHFGFATALHWHCTTGGPLSFLFILENCRSDLCLCDGIVVFPGFAKHSKMLDFPAGPHQSETCLGRSGSSSCAFCPRNQPKRLHVRPFHGHFPFRRNSV